MEWLKKINNAIDYIENNLDSEISYDEAAQIACCSTYYFQRMFTYITGISLAEYIRRRRMTQAAFELQRTDKRVLEVALKYGYTSPTSFNRAFQNVHGISPIAAKDIGSTLNAYMDIRKYGLQLKRKRRTHKMYHLRLKGEHYQMGVKRGTIFQRGNISFPLHLDTFQLEHGKQSEKILRKFFPEVCEEIRGVSDTIGADYISFISWMLCMGCCMYNLENNIPVEIRGCTAFAYSKDGNIIYGRNNDLPPYLRDGSKSEIYSPINGNRFNITTSSFINGEEGLNEHGLAVAMTFVMTRLEKIKPGFNSCFIVRYLLEKANNTEMAMALLMELPIASNCNILLADKNGKMVVVECTPTQKRVREAVTSDNGNIVCTVNSFTSDEYAPYDDAKGDDYDSAKRYKVVMDSFIDKITDDYFETTTRLLKGEYGFMCQYEDPNFQTVWSSIFNLKSLMVYRAEGDPRKKKFVTDSRLHDIKFGK